MRGIRLARRISQQRIADHVGLPRTTIHKIETGLQFARIDKAEQIAAFLGVETVICFDLDRAWRRRQRLYVGHGGSPDGAVNDVHP